MKNITSFTFISFIIVHTTLFGASSSQDAVHNVFHLFGIATTARYAVKSHLTKDYAAFSVVSGMQTDLKHDRLDTIADQKLKNAIEGWKQVEQVMQHSSGTIGSGFLKGRVIAPLAMQFVFNRKNVYVRHEQIDQEGSLAHGAQTFALADEDKVILFCHKSLGYFISKVPGTRFKDPQEAALFMLDSVTETGVDLVIAVYREKLLEQLSSHEECIIL